MCKVEWHSNDTRMCVHTAHITVKTYIILSAIFININVLTIFVFLCESTQLTRTFLVCRISWLVGVHCFELAPHNPTVHYLCQTSTVPQHRATIQQRQSSTPLLHPLCQLVPTQQSWQGPATQRQLQAAPAQLIRARYRNTDKAQYRRVRRSQSTHINTYRILFAANALYIQIVFLNNDCNFSNSL